MGVKVVVNKDGVGEGARKYKEQNSEVSEENQSENNRSCESGEVYTSNVTFSSKGVLLGHSQQEAGLFFENLTWLTSEEAAHYLRMPSVGALRILVFKRKIPFHKLGRRLRFKKVELDCFLDRSGNGEI